MRKPTLVLFFAAFGCSSLSEPQVPDIGFRVLDAGPQAAVDAANLADAGARNDAQALDSGSETDAGAVDAGAPSGPCAVDFVVDLRARQEQPQSVTLAGDFNEWSADSHTLSPIIAGVYGLQVELEQGEYAYKFVIDNEQWITDPQQPAVHDDGQGNVNSLLRNDCRGNTDSMLRLAHSFNAQDGALVQQSYLIPAGLAEVRLQADNFQGLTWQVDGGRQLQVTYGAGLTRLATLLLRWESGAERRIPVGPELVAGHDWRRDSLYFVMIDRFANGRQDNDFGFDSAAQPVNYQGGDLLGLKQQLEAGYFDDLGLGALWLSWPMQGPERPMAGHRLDLDPRSRGCGLNPYDEQLPRAEVQYSGFHGYWPTDLEQVDRRFGNDAELEALVQAAHARGVAVLLDLPANHLHEDHALVQDESKRDWFNYPAQVCGADVPWDEAPETCWFTEYLPDLNLANPAARSWLVEQAISVAERYGVDGFRIDAVKHLDRSFLRDLRHGLRARLEIGGQKLWTIGETFSGDAGSVASYLGEQGVHAQFDFPTNYQLLETFAQGHLSLGQMDANVRLIKAAYSQELMVNFIGNHDIARFTSLASGQLCGAWDMASNQALGWHTPPQAPSDRHAYKRLLQALTYAFTVPGQPMIYYGDEFGMSGGGDPDNRRFMRRGDALNGNESWLRGEVAKLASLRARNDGLRSGSWPAPALADENSLAFVRQGENNAALVIINRGAARSMDLALIEQSLHGAIEELFSGAQATMNADTGHRFELAAESVQIWTRSP